MRYLILAGLVLTAGTVAVAADPEFHPYETRGPLIKEGQGGARTTIDGIDIWDQGEPPRRYQILGTITDTRCNCDGWFQKHISVLNSDIAKTAKQAGGDAAILDKASNVVTDVYGKVTESGRVNTYADEDRISRYLVVKYLPDLPATATPPAQHQ
jgi:hypothetical protein